MGEYATFESFQVVCERCDVELFKNMKLNGEVVDDET